MMYETNKTKELAFHRPRPRRWTLPILLDVAQVQSAKLLGIAFQSIF